MRVPALLGLLAIPWSSAGARQWTALESNTRTEFRALHAVDTRVVWVAGKGGVVGHTRDGGSHWSVDSIPGAGGLFLVGLHALDAERAWVVGTAFEGASLARIYATVDGGKSWRLQYENTTPGVFFDGLTFWDGSRGIAFGDPIAGRLMVVTTGDGGDHWSALPPERSPAMLPREAAFAASGTAIAVRGPSDVWIATGGGSRARVLHSADGGGSWQAFDTPAGGGNAKGLFGIAPGSQGRIIAVGGDYQQREASLENLLLSDDGIRWRIGSSPELLGVQYGVAYAGGERFVAVGPGGSARSEDGGTTWTRLEGPGYNTVHCAQSLCWAAGIEGRIARLAVGN